MLYVDTGCFLKLYYPEPASAAVAAAAVRGEIIIITPLHELEMTAAMRLKVFRGEASFDQADAASSLIQDDLLGGTLVEATVDWAAVFREAKRLANKHAGRIGCRSLDILHCALAKTLSTAGFVSSDTRQIALARAESMNVLPI